MLPMQGALYVSCFQNLGQEIQSLRLNFQSLRLKIQSLGLKKRAAGLTEQSPDLETAGYAAGKAGNVLGSKKADPKSLNG